MRDTDLQQKRLLAATIDIGIAVALGIGVGIFFAVARVVFGLASAGTGFGRMVQDLLTILIALVGLAYLLGRDLFGGGRSFGKKAMNIRVVTAAGGPISMEQSAKRNAIFSLGSVLFLFYAVVNLVVGFFSCAQMVVGCLLSILMWLGALASLAAAVVEVVRITQDAEGIRYGDQYAGTRVVS